MLGLCCLGLLLFVAWPSASAHAATISVDTEADELDILPATGTGCSLREAIQAANQDGDFGGCTGTSYAADTIQLRPGLYRLTRSGRHEDANATGDLDLTGELTITGAGAADTIVEAGP